MIFFLLYINHVLKALTCALSWPSLMCPVKDVALALIEVSPERVT